MTREEAIEVLQQDIPCELDTDLIEALEMAIKALEQEPCEDSISRQAVLDLFNKSNEFEWEISLIRRKIEKLPSVKPQYTDDEIQKMQELEQAEIQKAYELGKPKTGHWISYYDEDTKESWYECDRCHTKRAFNTKFCPDCGCRIVGIRHRKVRTRNDRGHEDSYFTRRDRADRRRAH